MTQSGLAGRLRRPTWRDPRLGVGVLLVAGSIALGTWAVRDAAGTVAVYALREAVAPGDTLTDETLTVRQVRLGQDERPYLRVQDGLPADAVALRGLGAGELLPHTAVGVADSLDLRPVVVPLGAAVPSDVGPGSVVDLWRTPPPVTAGAQPDGEPALLAGDLIVAEVLREESMFTGGVSVELLVPRAALAAVLGALPAEGQLVIVPTAVTAPTGSPAGPG